MTPFRRISEEYAEEQLRLMRREQTARAIKKLLQKVRSVRDRIQTRIEKRQYGLNTMKSYPDYHARKGGIKDLKWALVEVRKVIAYMEGYVGEDQE